METLALTTNLDNYLRSFFAEVVSTSEWILGTRAIHSQDPPVVRIGVPVPWLRKQVVDKLAEIVGARIKNILDVESFSILKELDRCQQLLN